MLLELSEPNFNQPNIANTRTSFLNVGALAA